MNEKINIVKAAVILAGEKVRENFRRVLTVTTGPNPDEKEVQKLMFQEGENGEMEYKPKVREKFNDLYDRFYNLLIACKSDEEENN